MRRGYLTLQVLEILTEALIFPAEMATGLFLLSERSTVGRAIYLADKRIAERDKRQMAFANLKQVNNVIYRLQKEGLITKRGDLMPILNSKGRKLMRELRGSVGAFPEPNTYNFESGEKLTLIIFDIPEKQKAKRAWLRNVLKYLDYKMIQKSVWLGANKFPAEAVADFEALNLLNCVHIFSIDKSGTLTDKFK